MTSKRRLLNFHFCSFFRQIEFALKIWMHSNDETRHFSFPFPVYLREEAEEIRGRIAIINENDYFAGFDIELMYPNFYFTTKKPNRCDRISLCMIHLKIIARFQSNINRWRIWWRWSKMSFILHFETRFEWFCRKFARYQGRKAVTYFCHFY